ncbi:hydantoinase B/oxoprolinase family protein [Mesobacterium pallidum]|uniref:hydantoinase B/oxoprolinase family protein n=1 Tax=Mesobacterium pallidum TaxID=2872037 RepID=UPI001EE295CB|nr:hydantoinase B/oxoprolinase family protein [Mesobacterium pallidum]
MSRSKPTSKAAEIEIISGLFISAAEQMRRTLVRTAFNPVIYEVLDFGISIADAKGRMIAEAAGITSFIGANDYALGKLIETLDHDELRPGDVIMLNTPYWNSAHTSDALLVTPVFLGSGGIDIWLCVRAHWLDIGAKDAGYVLDSTDVHQEGLLMPGVRVIKEGKLDKEIWAILRANSRLPDAIEGDFNAQVACLRTGEKAVAAIFAKFGKDRVAAAVDAYIDYSDAKTREALAGLPRGTWSSEEWLDDDGVTDTPIKMVCTVTITDDEFIVDYTGTDPQVAGPVNIPIGGTITMAKTYFKYLTQPGTPSNHGSYAPLRVEVPEGTLFSATYPAATYVGWSKMVAFEMIAKALAPVIDWIPASSGGDEPGFMAVGKHYVTGRPFVISNNEGIGWGATHVHDGANALQHPSTSTVRNTPIEVMERQTNLFHTRLELVENSGGLGQYRGGLGVRRDVQMAGDTEILSMKKKCKTRTWALHGGEPSQLMNHMVLWPDQPRQLKVGMYRKVLKTGESFANFAAGGSGWGDPAKRDPAAAAYDLANGYVTESGQIEPLARLDEYSVRTLGTENEAARKEAAE